MNAASRTMGQTGQRSLCSCIPSKIRRVLLLADTCTDGLCQQLNCLYSYLKLFYGIQFGCSLFKLSTSVYLFQQPCSCSMQPETSSGWLLCETQIPIHAWKSCLSNHPVSSMIYMQLISSFSNMPNLSNPESAIQWPRPMNKLRFQPQVYAYKII